MKKLFTLLFAALLSVSMFGRVIREDISLNASDWSWGYGSAVVADGNMLKCILTSEWGAMAIGWNEPTRDLSEWDKIVIVVENMNGCDGEWFKLKAYLRDSTENEANQMEGLLGLDAPDNQKNYLVIDLHQQKAGFYLTKAKILAIQCQPNGAEFKISRVYLEKDDGEPEVVRELTKLGINFPTANCPADNNIAMAGSFTEGTMAMDKIYATGWFVNYDFVNAAADDTFKFRAANNNNLVLCKFISHGNGVGNWVQAIFKFGDYWQDDIWKGTPCKFIEIDLSNPNQYAWMVGMPEPDSDPMFDISYENRWLNIVPNDTTASYLVYIEDKQFYDNRYGTYDQTTMGGYLDYIAGQIVSLNLTSSFVMSGDQQINPNIIYSAAMSAGMSYNSDYVVFVFKFENNVRTSDVEYLVMTYSGAPYTVTANAYPWRAGEVSVSYNAEHTQATLTAIPYSGYHFAYWKDGNTQNPRTIILTSDVTTTAYFEQDVIDPSQGRVWPILMDDVTYAQKQQYVVSDFRPNDEDNNLYVWENTYVGANISGLNFYGNTEGYLALYVSYMGWSGAGYNVSGVSAQSAEALRQEIIANPSDYYLHFAIKSTDNYSHCFYFMDAENAGAKLVIGSSSVYDGPVYADFTRDGAWHEFYIPMSQYAYALAQHEISTQYGANIFAFLSEGVQGAQLNLDAVYFCNTAYKNAQTTPTETYYITAYASPSYAGYVDVMYSADHKTALLTATPYSGYHFTQWSDGMTINPRTLTLTKDVTITAYFELDQVLPQETNLTVNSADPVMGSAYGSGMYLTGTYQQIFAISLPGYYFTQWSDGNAENPRQLYLSEAEMILTANFERESSAPTYTVDVASSDLSRGTTEVEQYVRIEAIPAEGCEFVAWSDGDTSNPRFVKLDRDIMLRAIFSGTPHGFDNVSVNPNAQVHKIIVNDQVFIIRGDQTFTITGQEVK